MSHGIYPSVHLYNQLQKQENLSFVLKAFTLSIISFKGSEQNKVSFQILKEKKKKRNPYKSLQI